MINLIEKFKELKSVGIYASSELIYKGLNWALLLILFFLSKDNPADYGLLAVLIAFERIVSVIIDFGQKRVIYRFYNDESKENSEFLSSTFTAWITVSLIVLMLFYLILIVSGEATFFEIPIKGLFGIELLNLLLLNIISFIYCLHRISKNIKEYAKILLIIGFSRFFLTIILSISGLLVYDSYIWGMLIGLLLGIFHSKSLFKKYSISIKINFQIIKRNLLYGYPLVLQQAISNLGPNIDKFFLTKYVSLADIGQYNFIITLTTAFSFLYSIGTSYFEPALFRTKNNESKFLNINNTFLHTNAFFSSIIIIVTSILLYYINKSQIDVYIVIAVAYSLMPLYFYNTYVYMVHDNNIDVVKWSAVAVTVVFVGDFYLIGNYGILGAAYAQLLYTFILSWVSYAYMINKYPTQKYGLNIKMGILVLLSFVLAIPINTYMYILSCLIMLGFSAYFLVANKSIVFDSLKL